MQRAAFITDGLSVVIYNYVSAFKDRQAASFFLGKSLPSGPESVKQASRILVRFEKSLFFVSENGSKLTPGQRPVFFHIHTQRVIPECQHHQLTGVRKAELHGILLCEKRLSIGGDQQGDIRLSQPHSGQRANHQSSCDAAKPVFPFSKTHGFRLIRLGQQTQHPFQLSIQCQLFRICNPQLCSHKRIAAHMFRQAPAFCTADCLLFTAARHTGLTAQYGASCPDLSYAERPGPRASRF